VNTIIFEIYENPRGKVSVQDRLGYRGPLQRRGSTPRIILDLSDDEPTVLDPVWREVHHPDPQHSPIPVKAVIPKSLGTRSQRIKP